MLRLVAVKALSFGVPVGGGVTEQLLRGIQAPRECVVPFFLCFTEWLVWVADYDLVAPSTADGRQRQKVILQLTWALIMRRSVSLSPPYSKSPCIRT